MKQELFLFILKFNRGTEFYRITENMTERITMEKTILVVDDDALVRSLLDEAFKKKGYNVILAEHAEEAIQNT